MTTTTTRQDGSTTDDEPGAVPAGDAGETPEEAPVERSLAARMEAEGRLIVQIAARFEKLSTGGKIYCRDQLAALIEAEL